MEFLSQIEDKASKSVSDEELRALAGQVTRRGLTGLSIFVLEMYKPLATLGYNMALTSYPLLLPIFGPKNTKMVLGVMQSRKSLEKLISFIEELEEH